MSRHCPNCSKPRLDELPVFCNSTCEGEYSEWVRQDEGLTTTINATIGNSKAALKPVNASGDITPDHIQMVHDVIEALGKDPSVKAKQVLLDLKSMVDIRTVVVFKG